MMRLRTILFSLLTVGFVGCLDMRHEVSVPQLDGLFEGAPVGLPSPPETQTSIPSSGPPKSPREPELEWSKIVGSIGGGAALLLSGVLGRREWRKFNQRRNGHA